MSLGTRRSFTLAAMLALAGSAFGAPAMAQDEPQPGGTIIFGEWQPATQLNAYFTTAFTNVEAYSPVFRGLFNVNADGEWFGDLATEVPTVEAGSIVEDPSGDGFTVTMTMKPGLVWSDGEPLDMNDQKWTYDWAVEVAKSGVGCTGCSNLVPTIATTDANGDPLDLEAQYAPENQYVESITVSDDGLSMDVKYRKNFAGWIGQWGTVNSPIMPQQYFESIAYADLPSSVPLGSGIENVPAAGPFKFSAASSDGIDYVRNDLWNGGTKPLLDGLKFRFFGSKDGQITAFLNGEIDLALDMTQADYPAIQGVDPSIGKAELDSVWQYEHLDFNLARTEKGLDDLAVRTALAMAIDKQDLINVLFPGTQLEPACSTAPPGTWWRDDSIQCPPYDPEGAAAMLDEAGWVVNPDTGVREKDGNQLRLQMCTTSGNPTRLTTLGKANQYFAAITVPSDITTADASSVVFAGWADTTPDTDCSIYRGTYDVADFAWVLSGDVWGNYYYIYHSSQIPSDSAPNGSNNSRIASPEMDAALDTLGIAVDPAMQKEAAFVVQQVVADTINEIPLYYRAETTGVGNHLGGWVKYNPSSAGPTYDVENWYFIP